jgi:putative addiction module killer protein
MITFLRSKQFDTWLSKLGDLKGKARIVERIRSAERGNFGDCSSVGKGVSEMRIHFGPGYRVYFKCQSISSFVLLCGGTKRTQSKDISTAQGLAALLGKS